MTKFGFYFNQHECIGCRACQIACNDRKRLDAGTTLRTVCSFETGVYPEATVYHYAATCNHCDNPACMAACPTGATQKAEDDGTVFRDADLCIGCGACTFACPYGHPVLLPEGISGRCDGCCSFRDNGKNPVCVDACVMRAIEWGDIDELRMAFEVVGALPDAGAKVDALVEQLLAAPDDLDRIADDYARIFVGPAALPAPPWESVYRDNKRLLMTATTLSVREYYRAYGYEAKQRFHVPDDHLAIELDFLASLAQEALDACAAGNEEDAQHLFEAGSTFASTHLARWVGGFATDLRDHDGSRFYCAIADALAIFVSADIEVG